MNALKLVFLEICSLATWRLDEEMFQEVCGLVRERNEVTWFKGEFDPPQLQFDFNGLWFDAPFEVLRF